MTGRGRALSAGRRGLLRAAAVVAGFSLPALAGAPREGRLAGESAHENLRSLLEAAPSRQVGQPGNRAVDELVSRVFADAVAAHNDPGRHARAKALVEEADRAEEKVARALLDAQTAGAAGDVVTSPLVVRLTLEDPWGFAFLSLIAGVAFLAAWWMRPRDASGEGDTSAEGPGRRRRAFAVAAGCSLGIAVLLVTVSALVETEAESLAKVARAGEAGAPRTEETLGRAVVDAGRAALAADLRAAEALRGLWQRGRVVFPSAAFVPGKAELGFAGGARARLYQMAPNLVEPANLPESGFEGTLVYAGTARPEELAGRDLAGAAVLVEFGSDNRWLDAVQLGADVVIVLEPPAESPASFRQAARKTTISPVRVPRFYLKREGLAAALGEGWRTRLEAGVRVSIRQEPGRWERAELASDWLFIPGAAPRATDGTLFHEDPSRQLVMIQAYKDSASVVPELSPGAAGATNLVVLMRLLDFLEREPPVRPVLLCVVNDHANALNGEQEFAFAAFAEDKALLREIEETDRELARLRFTERVFGEEPTPEVVEELRGRTETIGGRVFTVKEPATDRLSHLRNVVREERNRLEALMGELRGRRGGRGGAAAADAETQAIERRLGETRREYEGLVELMRLFIRLGAKVRLEELGPRQRARCTRLFAEVSASAREKADALERARRRLHRNLSVRRRLLHLHPAAPDGEEPPADSDETFRRRYPPLGVVAALSLDLSAGSDDVGFFYMGMLRRDTAFERDVKTRVAFLARHTLIVAAEHERATGRDCPLVDTIRHAGGIPWEGHLGGYFAMAARAAHQYAVPGLTLASVRDMRPHAFTPHDTPDRIDPGRLNETAGFAAGYLRRLIDSEGLGKTFRPVKEPETLSIEVTVRKQDRFSVKVPKQVLAGALVVPYARGLWLPPGAAMLGEVRPFPVFATDVRGVVTLRGSIRNNASLQAFAYDPDWREVTSALDFGEGEKRFISTVDLSRGTVYEARSVVTFDARKVDLLGLTEPLTLRPAEALDVIDAHQDSTPRHYSVSGVGAVAFAGKRMPLARDGSGCVFLEPGARFKLRIGSGLAIGAEPGHPQGLGFPAEAGLLRNIALTSARDMWRLSDSRIGLLSKKGVVDEAAASFNRAARVRLGRGPADGRAARARLGREPVESGAGPLDTPGAEDEVEGARARADAGARRAGPSRELSRAEEARGLAQRAYARSLGTLNDLIKAVVIFLALVIPFCFFVMKLVTPFTDVNRQLALFGGVFVAMAIVLEFVHPAFEVAKTPHVVVLAFVILGLAVFVAGVIVGRFNSSMTQAVEESQMAESADAPQSRLAGAAFMVGVNNMKRRRIRTSLTCATVVLVTFTMLSVISVSQDAEPVRLRLSGEAPYDGFLYTSPGLGPIDDLQLARLRDHFGERAGDGVGGETVDVTTVSRVWAERKGAYGEYLPFELAPDVPARVEPVEGERTSAAPSLGVKVVLGLERAEDGFLGPMPVLPGGRWFSSDEAPEVLVSRRAAAHLGIAAEGFRPRRMRLHGRGVELVGLLDDEALESMTDIADLPLLPLLGDASLESRSLTRAIESAGDAAALAQGGGLADLPGMRVARTDEVAFAPAEFARSLGDARFRTFGVKYGPAVGRADAAPAAEEDARAAAASERVWDDAERLMRFQDVRLFVSVTRPVADGASGVRADVGQYALASSSSAEIGGVLKVAIPVALVATIILNTMLGSVMERRREIGIYNAIGLNPTHVMVFFLAESLVFGLVGSVAGYLIGQTLSLVVGRFVDLNLNYSSLSVMLVIFLAIATVLVSTVYPAMMAARAAVPSGQRRWSLPQPVGDLISLKFPFSYDARRVLGVCAFLREYMQQNSEASTGRFLAGLGPVGVVPVAPGEHGLEGGARSSRTAGEGVSAEAEEQPDGKAYVMIFDIAPAPFDLGVNQKMEVYACRDPRVRAHMLSVHLTRMSGEKTNWVTVNQPFLEAMRKRLLSWRSQRPETQAEYCARGEELFASARELPVVEG